MESIEALQKQVMGALVSHFGLSDVARMDAHPPVFEAYREHIDGLRFFGVDYGQAMGHFERAAKIDSTFLAPRIFLVFAYANQGRRAEADSLVQLLKRGGQRLTPYQRLYIEVMDALLSCNYAECMRYLRQLEKKTPNANDINFLIGLMAIRMNHPQEAVDAYAGFEGPAETGKT